MFYSPALNYLAITRFMMIIVMITINTYSYTAQ